MYDEYNRRVAIVSATSEEVVKLYAELGIPQAQTDSHIVANYRDSPEQLGLHQSDLKNLQGKRDRLVDEKKNRERKLKELKVTVEGLWDRLGVEDPDRKAFLAANRGCGLRTINEFEEELGRLNELKRQNLHLFVEDARCQLQELWDSLYFSEEEMLDFTPAFSDVYSDALLSAHEAEISRLQALKEQRAPILALVDKHRSIIKDREDLAASANDATRLMLKPAKGEKRDPGKLLREEKMRKRIAKELPKLEAELRKTLESWEDEYGHPFLVHGERYLDEMEAVAAIAKPVPARSKTPNGLPPRAKTPAGPPPSTTKHARGNSQSVASNRNGTVGRNAAPQPTAKTPTGTMRRNPFASSTSTAPSIQSKSPSKIPSRVPLGKLNDGGNSPERRMPAPSSTVSTANTIRKMAPPPARAPPPKMRDLFVPPNEETPVHSWQNQPRPQSTLSHSSSNASISNHSSASSMVRPISPEDPYDDRVERMSYMSASLVNRDAAMNGMNRPPGSSHTFQDYHSRQQNSYPSGPPSRQISNTSSNLTTGTTASAATSGSENWETFDDQSDIVSSEQDHESHLHQQRQQRFNQHQAQQNQSAGSVQGTKRPYILDNNSNMYSAAPGQMMPPPPPKVRGVMPSGRPGGHGHTFVEVMGDDGHIMQVRDGSVSEAGWTDDTNDY